MTSLDTDIKCALAEGSMVLMVHSKQTKVSNQGNQNFRNPAPGSLNFFSKLVSKLKLGQGESKPSLHLNQSRLF